MKLYKKIIFVFNKVTSPSKFGPGISSIWSGFTLNLLIEIIFKCLIKKNKTTNKEPNEFLFSSARSAIAAVLNTFQIGKNDEVIVCSFTCDAVTHAILSTKAKPVYVDINNDLSMNEFSVKRAINLNTKAILVQNTFGRLGLSEDFISSCKDKKILMIEDNCLSIGSKINNTSLGKICPISIWSLEVSKSITIGWGGVLHINDIQLLYKFEKYIKKVGKITLLSDLHRLIQLFISLFLYRFSTPFSFLIWYFLYAFRIFRKSSDENQLLKNETKLMGKLSELIYKSLKPKLKNLFLKANSNYRAIDLYAKDCGIKIAVEPKNNEFIVSPRFSFYADQKNHEKIFKIAKLNKIDLTTWFSDVPPSSLNNYCEVGDIINAKEISKKIINIPIYWTFSKKEISKITKFLKTISELAIT